MIPQRSTSKYYGSAGGPTLRQAMFEEEAPNQFAFPATYANAFNTDSKRGGDMAAFTGRRTMAPWMQQPVAAQQPSIGEQAEAFNSEYGPMSLEQYTMQFRHNFGDEEYRQKQFTDYMPKSAKWEYEQKQAMEALDFDKMARQRKFVFDILGEEAAQNVTPETIQQAIETAGPEAAEAAGIRMTPSEREEISGITRRVPEAIRNAEKVNAIQEAIQAQILSPEDIDEDDVVVDTLTASRIKELATSAFVNGIDSIEDELGEPGAQRNYILSKLNEELEGMKTETQMVSSVDQASKKLIGEDAALAQRIREYPILPSEQAALAAEFPGTGQAHQELLAGKLMTSAVGEENADAVGAFLDIYDDDPALARSISPNVYSEWEKMRGMAKTIIETGIVERSMTQWAVMPDKAKDDLKEITGGAVNESNVSQFTVTLGVPTQEGQPEQVQQYIAPMPAIVSALQQMQTSKDLPAFMAQLESMTTEGSNIIDPRRFQEAYREYERFTDHPLYINDKDRERAGLMNDFYRRVEEGTRMFDIMTKPGEAALLQNMPNERNLNGEIVPSMTRATGISQGIASARMSVKENDNGTRDLPSLFKLAEELEDKTGMEFVQGVMGFRSSWLEDEIDEVGRALYDKGELTSFVLYSMTQHAAKAERAKIEQLGNFNVTQVKEFGLKRLPDGGYRYKTPNEIVYEMKVDMPLHEYIYTPMDDLVNVPMADLEASMDEITQWQDLVNDMLIPLGNIIEEAETLLNETGIAEPKTEGMKSAVRELVTKKEQIDKAREKYLRVINVRNLEAGTSETPDYSGGYE